MLKPDKYHLVFIFPALNLPDISNIFFIQGSLDFYL